MIDEIWKPVKDFEGLYEVSNLGRVRSLPKPINYKGIKTVLYKGKVLKGSQDKAGYIHVILHKNTKPYVRLVHRLVAVAFIPNPNNYREVNHINANKTDNRVENLEWCTCQQNKDHAVKNGLTAIGERNSAHKLTETEVKKIRAEYVKDSHDFNTWSLAKRYGVSQTTIRMIVNNKTWRYCL